MHFTGTRAHRYFYNEVLSKPTDTSVSEIFTLRSQNVWIKLFGFREVKDFMILCFGIKRNIILPWQKKIKHFVCFFQQMTCHKIVAPHLCMRFVAETSQLNWWQTPDTIQVSCVRCLVMKVTASPIQPKHITVIPKFWSGSKKIQMPLLELFWLPFVLLRPVVT